MKYRTWTSKNVQQLAADRGLGESFHRESLARISDRYHLGARNDTPMGAETGPRRWNEDEAKALVEIMILRRAGYEYELIDRVLDTEGQAMREETSSLLAVMASVSTKDEQAA